ncbi:MAG: D-2-hydroxyacid dehydrogenase family protein [Hyphomicrobiaceae bacterium]
MRIAVLDDYQGVALTLADWSKIAKGHDIVVFRHPLGGLETTAAALADFDVVAIMRERTPFLRPLLERLTKLRLLVTTGLRNDSIDLVCALERGVVVCGTTSPGYATAELTFALILALARNLHREAESMRSGGWQVGLGSDLRGKTLGIVGLGRLGGEVAGFARAFGMRIVAWSQNLTAETAAGKGAERVGKADLFKQADFITVHIKLSDRSRGLVGPAEIAAMKPTAYLVNTSRSAIVDRVALVQALQSGAIAGAALDVYDEEPLPADHALRRVPNLLPTPHIGYVTRETYRAFYTGTVEAIEAWMAGTPVYVLKP